MDSKTEPNSAAVGTKFMPRGYKAYPSYKDSGVEWLGDVPEDWSLGLLSSLFDNNKNKNSELNVTNLLSLSYGNIVRKDIDGVKGLLPESFNSYQIVDKGYIVLRLTDLQNDKKSLRTGYVNERGIITSAYVGLKRKSNAICNERYFHLYLHSFDIHKGFYGMGAGVRQGLNFDELKKLPFTLPSEEEQSNIVTYLDKATTKIDTLIEKQTKLIELLKEKRQAVISSAVTRGLDASVPMKESGVEWLGEIPEHWVVCKIKYYGSYRSGDFISGESIDSSGKFPVLGGNGLRGYTAGYNLIGNFVLIGRQGALCGNINYSSGKFWATEHAIVVHHSHKVNVKWLGENLRTMNLNQYSVSAAQPGLAVENIINMKSTFPPITEQIAIADYISYQTSKINNLITKSTQAIDLLKEKRTALISAAVTGKIDVRDAA